MSFDILYKSSLSRARCGLLNSPHGTVQTPAFVTVGTKASVKSLPPDMLGKTNTQFIFVNTYHIVLSPGEDIVFQAGGVHEFSKLDKPIITDSGGFQVFSLGRKDADSPDLDEFGKNKPSLVKIDEDGVEFRSHIDGRKVIFTPEFSIDAQKKIGADFIVAFDEDILNKASRKYTKESTDRTHRWAKRSITELKKGSYFGLSSDSDASRFRHLTAPSSARLFTPIMYGVIHGGRFEDLRKWSAETIAGMDFGALALGGVSVGLDIDELAQETQWVSDVIHTDPRPRHLLGIGTLRDVIQGVKMGFDSFDCVLPTRYARMGRLYDFPYDEYDITEIPVKKDYDWTLDISKKQFAGDMSPVSSSCECYTCKNFTRAYLHHLFKQRELLAYSLTTIHNLYFIEDFFAKIREYVKDGRI
ncbi:MAG: tRNA guanosine(34) transglycosylase Tgt [Candidatus Roizmanbacteria bacterium]